MVVVGIVVMIWCALRIAEHVLSVLDTVVLREEGAVEACSRQHVPLLLANLAVPALVLAACWLAVRRGEPVTVGPATWAWLAVLVVAECVHWWAIATLGRRWTTGVLVLPGEAPVVRGPYRWLRHPGYAAGVTSAVALPLVAGAWVVAAPVAVMFAVVVVLRVRCEDRAWLDVGAAA
ncbi:isoprenylcysteine carboxylmethyltransferase family protein [Longivirga aurantiaca]|uniref:Isoprenylcysteine carboxylmethyltransferase family protein n=1 Tax=Longivirga aurantiaca TaxID=1837743 RepID=A0ABW1T033_9ACTN